MANSLNEVFAIYSITTRYDLLNVTVSLKVLAIGLVE